MTELRERVTARLLAAQNAQDPAALREPDAVGDAFALLREAAPSPEGPIDLDSVLAVFWTFWFGHHGADAPEAQRDTSIVVSTFGFLQPRVPEHIRFPEPLRESFDPADPAHDARFAYLVSSVHADVLSAGESAEPDQLAALNHALAWSDTARQLLPEDHEGFIELTVHALGIEVARFQLAADPAALAAAARHGREVCERLAAAAPGSVGPGGADAWALALTTVLDAARLLGDPPLTGVERLVTAAPDGALTREAGEGLRFLRAVHAEPAAWPGQRDLQIGAAIAQAGMQEHDPARIACAVHRLRAALEHTPGGHPAHGLVTATLSEALGALAAERGDDGMAREAAELLATVDATGASSDADQEQLALLQQLHKLTEDDDPVRLRAAGPLVERLVGQFRQQAAESGEAPDIDLETMSLAATLTTGAVSDQRIARYRTALAALPADKPHRYAYTAVLAALTGLRAHELRETQPTTAARLDSESRALTEETAATAPAGLLLLGLLRKNAYDAALPVAVMAVLTGEPDGRADPEMAEAVSRLSRMTDIRLDGPDHMEADITVIRELLERLGENETDERAYLSAALGTALSSRRDPADLDEVVRLLRYARSHASELPEGIDAILARALTAAGAGRLDPEAAREAAALLAGLAAAAEPSDIGRAVLSADTEFHNALQNYLTGHEPGQLHRAREMAQRLKALSGAADAGAEELPPGFDVRADHYLDLLDTVGPGGGPKRGITEELVERCRRTYEACPPGHPTRISTAMTLIRALALRALEIREADHEHALRLVGEAGHLVDAVEQDAPDDWADMMRPIVVMVASGVLGRHLPPVSSDRAPETPAPEPANALEAMLRPILNRMAGVADPTVLRDPRIPVWFRAHGEIGAAAGALGRPQPRIDLALSHLEAAVEAMPSITDRGSDQQSAEHGLTSFEGDIRAIVELTLSAILLRDGLEAMNEYVEAAHQHVAALEEIIATASEKPGLPEALPTPPRPPSRVIGGPDVDRTTELLERGRGLLLSRRLEARAELSELRSGHPALASDFERLTDQLADISEAPDPAPAGHAERSRLARLRASHELDELVERIRSQPGFDDFLRPLSAGQLRSLAADGPIVVLNHARRYCHALVVTSQSIKALCLEAESDEITQAARNLREAVDAINAQGPSRRSPAELIAAGTTISRTLSWTWHKIVQPVLALVGANAPVPGTGPWPRIWWVPTGAFNALPLHAAQCTQPDCELGDCGAALDAVVSSYAPGFQTLAYARARAQHRDTADSGSALLVAAPEDELPGVAAAADYAAGLLGAHRPLVGAPATRAAVLAGLGDASWVHFGCHAATDPAAPSGALLHLPSGEPLSVLEICRARPRSARLAFLAACGTARTSERLSDEALHITSAFLLAGFPAAIGTLWEIDSTHADHVTRDFYRRSTGADAAAHALHHCIRALRQRIPNRPHVWAAYVHAGS
ncbi:CHAT domain-containing protein [Streptomyces sp. NPDC052101]|uniref:CHAT domain-containing protein n=1 Tax=Streptomyces sp. NPDC052101 TaxID=3155763 RepID=UPI003422D88B